MLEKDFENVLSRYPELIQEGITFLGRQVSIGGKFADLLFEDRFGQKLIVELKKGTIRREHVAQLLDYEGYFLSPDNPNVRVMLIGNRVPPNLRKSLDHHGFEWKEISVSKLIEHLENKNDKELLEQFKEEDKQTTPSKVFKKSGGAGGTRKGKTSGLPQLNKASNFEELKEIINIRSPHVPSCYMDKLLLENTNKTISSILEHDMWPYAEKIEGRRFQSVAEVKKHIKYREERGWEYEIKGNPADPIVRHVGFKK